MLTVLKCLYIKCVVLLGRLGVIRICHLCALTVCNACRPWYSFNIYFILQLHVVHHPLNCLRFCNTATALTSVFCTRRFGSWQNILLFLMTLTRLVGFWILILCFELPKLTHISVVNNKHIVQFIIITIFRSVDL